MAGSWGELSETMRQLRRASGESLRQVENASMWRRGTLSQIENGKARPSLALVEFYDERYAGNGLLSSLFADANAIETAVGPVPSTPRTRIVPGDAMTVASCSVAAGTLVATGTKLLVQWTLHNRGSLTWRGRNLHRVGAVAGARLLCSAAQVPIPDTPPGETAVASCTVEAPAISGTVTGHWRMTHPDGAFCYAPDTTLQVTVVVA